MAAYPGDLETDRHVEWNGFRYTIRDVLPDEIYRDRLLSGSFAGFIASIVAGLLRPFRERLYSKRRVGILRVRIGGAGWTSVVLSVRVARDQVDQAKSDLIDRIRSGEFDG